MSELRKVRVVRGFLDGLHAYTKGDIIRPSGVVRDLWLRRKLVELVDDTAVPKTITVNVARGRGRPRGSKNKVSAL